MVVHFRELDHTALADAVAGSGYDDSFQMQWHGVDSGIYRVRRRKRTGLGEHYGVLSVGVLNSGVVEVIDLNRSGCFTQDPDGWRGRHRIEIVDRCPGREHAQVIVRLKQALYERRGYDLWKNNCEHFASWVVMGKSESTQVTRIVQTAKFAAGVTLAVVVIRALSSSDDEGEL